MFNSDHCANCDRAIDSAAQKFCPACGQPTPAQRIDWHFLGQELEHSVLHMDRGVLYSLKELMLRPGHLMRGYLEGRRAQQVKPLLLLMISAAAVLLLGKYLVGGDLVGSAMQDGYSQTKGARESGSIDTATVFKVFDQVKSWINAHFTAFTLILLPLEAAALRLAFRNRGLNYPEWLVVSAFLTVQAFVFMAIAILLRPWLPGVQAWSSLIVSLYNIYSLVQLFPGFSRWKTALRATLGLAMFMLAQSMIGAALAVVLLLAARM